MAANDSTKLGTHTISAGSWGAGQNPLYGWLCPLPNTQHPLIEKLMELGGKLLVEQMKLLFGYSDRRWLWMLEYNSLIWRFPHQCCIDWSKIICVCVPSFILPQIKKANMTIGRLNLKVAWSGECHSNGVALLQRVQTRQELCLRADRTTFIQKWTPARASDLCPRFFSH